MLARLFQFVKIHQVDIILALGVVLISLLSFAMGYISAEKQEAGEIKIERSYIPK